MKRIIFFAVMLLPSGPSAECALISQTRPSTKIFDEFTSCVASKTIENDNALQLVVYNNLANTPVTEAISILHSQGFYCGKDACILTYQKGKIINPQNDEENTSDAVKLSLLRQTFSLSFTKLPITAISNISADFRSEKTLINPTDDPNTAVYELIDD